MSRQLATLLCLMASATACSDDPLEPASSAALVQPDVRAAVERPAGGRCVTVTQALPPLPPPTLTLQITGTCRLRHLGRTKMEAIQVVDLQTGSFSNTTTYTAANGDQLFTSFAGQLTSADADGVTFVGVETYIGGSGRFEAAHGSSEARGTATQTDATGAGTGEYSTEGSITY